MARVLVIDSDRCGACDYLLTVCGSTYCPILGREVKAKELCSVGDDKSDFIATETQDDIDNYENRLDELRDCNSELAEALEKMTEEKEELEAQLSIERAIRSTP